MTVIERRTILLAWLMRWSYQGAFTASEIVDRTDLYDGHGRYDRCFDDLKWLEKHFRVERMPGRPARWLA